MSTTGPYRIRGEKPEDWITEINRIFELITDRLDALSGLRGHPKFYDYIEAKSDVVVVNSTNGLVLRDDANPPNYWRLTLDASGTLTLTNIGRNYP